MPKPRYITRLDKVEELSDEERETLQPVTEKFVFRTNDYYQSLIDWDDPDDPIRRLVIPEAGEMEEWGALDASGETQYEPVPGVEHKYQDTALLLVNDVCGAFCRFCFRKRLFMNDNDEVVKDVSGGVAYIAEHPEIDNVLLTGGDPLIMGTKKLARILAQLREIDHVQIIRMGSKMPAFNPFRFTEDPEMMEMFETYSTAYKRLYVMAHFNHPRELTDEAIKAMDMLRRAGVVTVNQTPLIRGVNDDVEVLAELLDKLSYIGVPPYYVFQCRPTAGNKSYSVPVEKSLEIFEQARMMSSGLAKRARFVMSHETGKVEVLGRTSDRIFMRYHRAHDPSQKGNIMIFRSNPDAHWLDDYQEFYLDTYAYENKLLPQWRQHGAPAVVNN